MTLNSGGIILRLAEPTTPRSIPIEQAKSEAAAAWTEAKRAHWQALHIQPGHSARLYTETGKIAGHSVKAARSEARRVLAAVQAELVALDRVISALESARQEDQ